MKLKPLGKKLSYYALIAFVSFVCIPCAFFLELRGLFWIAIVAFIISGSQTLDILISANCAKYGFFGHRGEDPLFEYEEGDAEYETEKQYQEND